MTTANHNLFFVKQDVRQQLHVFTMACSATTPFTLKNDEGAPASGEVHSNCKAISLFPSMAAA